MISIIMTLYNRQEYYKNALDSLANQTDHDFELLIYSNIPVEYDLGKFKDVKVIENAPIELGLKYAYGIRKAKYDKICFLEDDDTFAPNKVEYLNSVNFGYFHNNYNHLTEGRHNPGKGFNMSSIAINRKYFPDLGDELEEQYELSQIPDSFIYWYALENNISTTFSDEKLTNYRFRNYYIQQQRIIQNMLKQITLLVNANKYFASPPVKNIIRARLISDTIFLNSYKINYTKIRLKDVIWLLKQNNVEEKESKIITYFLTLPIWRKLGLKVIEKYRNKKANHIE